MMFRLYYWFSGTPASTPLGPWWYRDFDTELERRKFLADILPFVCSFCMIQSNNLPKHHYYLGIKPPKESHIICKVVVIELRKKIMKHRTIREEV